MQFLDFFCHYTISCYMNIDNLYTYDLQFWFKIRYLKFMSIFYSFAIFVKLQVY